MDLVQAAWMIRDLGQPVSAIDIEDDSVIAGGWDGLLKEWNGDGDLIWSAQCQDRIEAILRVDDKVIVTSGLHISCIIQGEIIWSNALEGSADMLAFYDGNIIATSSVYDIEHGDFMESAVWQFSLDGDLIEVDRMDERPWFIDAQSDLVVGLGRPKCGVLINGVHAELASESPITCGLSAEKGILFGHADGTISSLEGKMVCKESQSIESISSTKNGFVLALENGNLISKSEDGNALWSKQGHQITTQCGGFEDLHWCGRWDGLNGYVEVRNDEGNLISSAKSSRPRVSNSTENRVGIGFDDGQILIWENDLFNRRSKEEIPEQNSRKSALAAKLRSLRN